MFKWRKQGMQAKRILKKQEGGFRWRRTYNWVFVIPPLLLAGLMAARMEPILPIRSIQLAGTFEHLDQQEIESTLQVYLGQGFFSLNIHQLQEDLHARPWTESVSVRRIWPDRISVTIVEKKPVARWDGGHLLSDKARVYRADTRGFAQLPQVYAANHQPAWVLSQFYRLKARFNSVNEQMVSLRVDNRGALEVELINDLTIKLGRDDIGRKIERLIGVYDSQIRSRRNQIRRLDLRYNNGFAVAWKKEALQARDKTPIWSNSNV